ncbi:MAG TPA: alpha/beta fold hydrolase [Candidatus Deferrimicrobium sp.]|nr:alpha/beta fold hydrolase [Candidatus Deferrimicrobium sp.]
MSYEPENTWFNYCLDLDPHKIEEAITEEFIVSNGKRIHLDIYGKEEDLKTTVIFIHGTAVYSRFYVEFLYRLYQNGYRVVAPDLPGHGLSEGRRGHFDMNLLTATIFDVTTHVIDQFGEQVVVMGSSLGGITTLYAVANDDRIKAGVCHNAAIFNEGAHHKIVKLKGIYKILRPIVPVFSKIIPILRLSVWIYLDAHNLVHDKRLIEKMDIVLGDRLVSDKYTLKALATQMRAPLRRPIEDIETPVMIIGGDQDILFSVEYMQEIFDRLARSKYKRFEMLPNAPHLILHENREESLSRITGWLAEIL